VSVSADGRLKLRAITAEKYQQMVDAARRDGVNLVLISGFRSIEEQQYLFFQVKEQRGQDTTKRAEVSAPPRHSEHHTGYAIDVGDGNSPGTNLSQSFEKTAAFRWLQNNAARFSFELSFPRDNPQGIAYEPWHWRFVGDQDSLETFYQSRNLTDVEPSPGTSNTP
jgi:D-alanyl-D-alanine carboxypeptidase